MAVRAIAVADAVTARNDGDQTVSERWLQVRIPGTRVDEHMIVKRGDGSL
ncbi:MAG: hypothetical protein ABGZ23_21880 [Fuerstiella sp.]